MLEIYYTKIKLSSLSYLEDDNQPFMIHSYISKRIVYPAIKQKASDCQRYYDT